MDAPALVRVPNKNMGAAAATLIHLTLPLLPLRPRVMVRLEARPTSTSRAYISSSYNIPNLPETENTAQAAHAIQRGIVPPARILGRVGPV
jgi:hypothetical protein